MSIHLSLAPDVSIVRPDDERNIIRSLGFSSWICFLSAWTYEGAADHHEKKEHVVVKTLRLYEELERKHNEGACNELPLYVHQPDIQVSLLHS